MPSGRLLPRLVASAPRTKDKESTGRRSGWPTAAASDGTGGGQIAAVLEPGTIKRASGLCLVGELVDTTQYGIGSFDRQPGPGIRSQESFGGSNISQRRNTPRATDGSKGGPNQSGGALPNDAAMSGWGTPRAMNEADHSSGTKKCLKSSSASIAEPDIDNPRITDAPHVDNSKLSTSQSPSLIMSGWGTPAARDWKNGQASDETMDRNARPLNEQAVKLAGWPSPTVGNAMDSQAAKDAQSYRPEAGRIEGDRVVELDCEQGRLADER